MLWNDRSQLPLGISALVAFLIGWAGAILCMAQVWYIGPIARLVGDDGADVSCLFERSSLQADLDQMGNYVGFS
jgi:purine-cytosine permease-like protein